MEAKRSVFSSRTAKLLTSMLRYKLRGNNLVFFRRHIDFRKQVRGIMRNSILGTILLILFYLWNHAYTTKAGITSGFTRSEWPSTDIPLANEVFAIPKGYNAPQQVHITQGDYDGRAVIISWVTPNEPGSSKVFYGNSKHEYNHHAEGTFTNYTFYNYKSGYIHHCTVNDLEYDTKYYYKIGEDESARDFWFYTPPKIDPNACAEKEKLKPRRGRREEKHTMYVEKPQRGKNHGKLYLGAQPQP
ncbi:Bifunctional purple acid phosphatase 26 [Nymphaea thermarum]|nr:Bifunctional purple acid phosphatase 26 [Nymphaea thermarum]